MNELHITTFFDVDDDAVVFITLIFLHCYTFDASGHSRIIFIAQLLNSAILGEIHIDSQCNKGKMGVLRQ